MLEGYRANAVEEIRLVLVSCRLPTRGECKPASVRCMLSLGGPEFSVKGAYCLHKEYASRREPKSSPPKSYSLENNIRKDCGGSFINMNPGLSSPNPY